MGTQPRYGTSKKHSGLVLIMVTIALLAFIAISAFAIDITHTLMNKTRLQNAVDSVVLAGASVANNYRDETSTQVSIVQTYKQVVGSKGNFAIELPDTLDGKSLEQLSIQYSSTPNSGFSSTFPSTARHIYVRVAVSDFDLPEFLIQAFGLENTVGASAVAGPVYVGGTANLLPIGMCVGGETSTAHGYTPMKVYEIKSGSQSGANGLGAGNFHLLDIGSGKSDIKDALIGKNSVVVSQLDTILSEPGNAVGPTGDIDSRFDGGTVDGTYYASDIIVDEPSPKITLDNIEDYNNATGDFDQLNGGTSWGYSDYITATELALCLNDDSNCTPSNSGNAFRRVLPLPILDCASSTKVGGKQEFTVEDIGCFFLVQRYSSSSRSGSNNGGGSSGQQSIFGQFIESCNVDDGEITGSESGLTQIVLFKDPLSIGGGS